MSEFEQDYVWWLEELASAQDRCEFALATVIRYQEAGELIPPEVLTEYTDAHRGLAKLSSAYPTPRAEPVALASTA